MIKSADSLAPDSEASNAERDSDDDAIIIQSDREESQALSHKFLVVRGQRFFNAPPSRSDENSHHSDRLNPSLESSDRVASDDESQRKSNAQECEHVAAMALREIDVEIAAREMELATMKRARAVLAHKVTRE